MSCSPQTILLALFCSFLFGCSTPVAENQTEAVESVPTPRILFAVTSHESLGETGEATGYYLSEVAHPWKVLTEAGYEIDFVSPEGGKPPVDGYNLEDPINREFVENDKYQDRINHSLRPDEVDPLKYVAIHYAGGHGTMWDFPENDGLAQIAETIHGNGGIISAVCHGPAGLLNLMDGNGGYLVKGKRIAAFTNSEEKERGLADVVPFLLQEQLEERGAIMVTAANWEEQVVVDGRLITGQNPASAESLANRMVEVLEEEGLQPAS